MVQDARQSEEQATQRRAQILGYEYADTSQMPQRLLYKDVLSVQEMYQKRIVPMSVDKGVIVFGITTTTSQQVIHEFQARFTDVRPNFVIISDTGYREYMMMFDPPKKVT